TTSAHTHRLGVGPAVAGMSNPPFVRRSPSCGEVTTRRTAVRRMCSGSAVFARFFDRDAAGFGFEVEGILSILAARFGRQPSSDAATRARCAEGHPMNAEIHRARL